METIIIQDNDASVLDVLTIALREENFEVFAINEFAVGFMAVIDKLRPHVIMLDYCLKGEKAIEILLKVKKKYKHLPIIALSCNHNIKTIAMELGFDDYIKKPFDLDRLFTILRKHIPQNQKSTL